MDLEKVLGQFDWTAAIGWVLSQFDWAAAIGWILGRAALIALLAVLCKVVSSIVRRLMPRIIQSAILKGSQQGDPDELAKRYKTLSDVAVKTFNAVVWVIFSFMSLSLLGADVTPVVAGVSVIGIAIGFGAQSLVKDVLAGLFVLLENQYGKDDVVKIAGISGYVQDVNLRRTVLRDLDGAVHNIPNGEVRVASNLTRDWSRVNMNVTLKYFQDIDLAIAVIDRIGEELAADPALAHLIVEAPKALRVEAFEDAGVVVKIVGVTKPGKQWEIMGQLRKRLPKAFENEGVEMPYPRRIVPAEPTVN